ncbi:hypothetical protein KA093_00875 [Candidatus Saccharibacteria bacterium]|nr:hypothetical protein [Candidatus Saccharibacteria bacterium]
MQHLPVLAEHLDRLEQAMQLWEVILIGYVIVNILILFGKGVPDGQPRDTGVYFILIVVLGVPLFLAAQVYNLLKRPR